jgi:site-specific recombinase XerD
MLTAELVQDFLQYTELVRGCRPKTVQAYAIDLRVFRHFQVAAGNRPLSAPVVVDFIRYLRVERKNGPAAVNRKLAALSALIDYCLVVELMAPTDDPRPRFPKLAAPPRPLPVVLNEDEMAALLAQPDQTTVLGCRDVAILTVMYATGLRVSEVCGLKLRDLDCKAKRILIRGKGGKQRYIPLDDTVEPILKAYMALRPDKGDMLFVSKKGGQLTPRALQHMVKKYTGGANIAKRVTPHKIRHSCATHLLQEGANLVAISRLLGHQSLNTTQIYLHITIQDLMALAQHHPLRRMRTAIGLRPDLVHSYQPTYLKRSG